MPRQGTIKARGVRTGNEFIADQGKCCNASNLKEAKQHQDATSSDSYVLRRLQVHSTLRLDKETPSCVFVLPYLLRTLGNVLELDNPLLHLLLAKDNHERNSSLQDLLGVTRHPFNITRDWQHQSNEKVTSVERKQLAVKPRTICANPSGRLKPVPHWKKGRRQDYFVPA